MPNDITNTSFVNLYLPLSEILITISISEKQGLCKDGLLRPQLPSSSPKERRRHSISLLNFITSTSTLYLYSSFSKSPIIIMLSVKRRLCLDGLIFWRRSVEDSIFNNFRKSENYYYPRKAWAVRRWPSLLEKVGMRPDRMRPYLRPNYAPTIPTTINTNSK